MSVSTLFFDERTIRERSNSHEFARGEEYQKRGRVRNLILEDGVYRAYVHRARYYLVKVWEENAKLRTSCSCSYNKPGVCRHTVATMIAIINRESRDAEAVDSGINVYEDGAFLVPNVVEPTVDEDDADDEEISVTALCARDLMSSPVHQLSEEASVADAWRLIQEYEIRHVPICGADGGVLGVVSERSLLTDAVADRIGVEGKPLSERKLRDLASTRLLTAGPDTGVDQIAQVMFEEKVGSLPIVSDGGELVGMITRSDILKAIVEGGLFGDV